MPVVAMSYKLKLDEPLGKGVRRIALGQLERACETRSSLAPANWVHEARKNLKRTRALLRLVRDGLEKPAWQRLNVELRDIGRLLAGHRDRDVRRETMARLATDARGSLAVALARLAAAPDCSHVSPGKARAGGQPTKPAEAMAITATDAQLHEAGKRLEAIRGEFARLDADPGLRGLAAGLARTHRAGRRCLLATTQAPSDDAFHELRKSVQTHWRQMQLVGAPWPELFKARVDAARSLAQCLGLEHDFAVLAQWLEASPPADSTPADRAAVVAACDMAKTQQRRRALQEAGLLFAGRPREFASECVAYWKSATAAGARRGAAEAPALGQKPGQKPGQKSRQESVPAGSRAAAAGGTKTAGPRDAAASHAKTAKRAPKGDGDQAPVRAKRQARSRPGLAGKA